MKTIRIEDDDTSSIEILCDRLEYTNQALWDNLSSDVNDGLVEKGDDFYCTIVYLIEKNREVIKEHGLS